MSIQWVTFSGEVPPNTLEAGNRGNGEALGIARAIMPNGELTGGKFWIAGKQAYIPWGGKETIMKDMQVLTADPAVKGDLVWVKDSGGKVPEGAVIAGTVSGGGRQYIGRGRQSGELIPGKVVPSHGVCYVGTGWKEHGLKDYEVLVFKEVTAVQDKPLA